MGIVRFALRFPHTFYVVAALILFLGIAAIRSMQTDIFPEIRIPVVTVIWSYTGLSTPEMEQRVTTYSQYSISANVNGIKNIEAQTMAGLSVQKIYFQNDVNLDLAISQIVAATNAIRALMPPGIQPPIVVQFNASSVPVLQISLSSDSLNEQQLYDYGIYRMRQQLAPIQGVTLPTPAGGKYRQIMVDLDPAKLLAKGLTPLDVVNAVNAQNLTVPSGTAKIGKTQYAVRTNSMPASIDELNNIPIKVVNGATLFVKDVGQVHDGWLVQQNIVRQDGRRSVLLSIIKNGNASTLAVVNAVRDALKTMRLSAPPGMSINELFDQSIFVKQSVTGVLREAAIAAALTALMILLFLGSWRSTLVVMISIPLSILTSLVVLYFLGETLNTMTLGGLALAVGILVDDSTVTIENTHRLLTEEHHPLPYATLHGAAEIAVPTLVSTLAISCVFTSVIFLEGPAKYLFTPLGLAVVFAMLASYGLSRTLTPITIGLLLKGERHGPATAPASGWFAGSGPGSAPFMLPSSAASSACARATPGCSPALLNHRFIIPGVAVLILVLGGIMLTVVGRDFFPAIDGGQIQLHVRAPAGTRIEADRAHLPGRRGQDPGDHSGKRARADRRQYRPAGAVLQSRLHRRLDHRRQRRRHPGCAQRGPRADRRICAQAPRRACDVVPGRRVLLPGGRYRDADPQLRPAGADRRAHRRLRQGDEPACRPRAAQAHRRDPRRRRCASAAGGRGAGVLCHHRPHARGPARPQHHHHRVQHQRQPQLVRAGHAELLDRSGVGHSLLHRRADAGVEGRLAERSRQHAGVDPSPTISADVPIPGLLSNVATFKRDSVPTNSNQANIQPVYDVYASARGRDLGSVARDINTVVADLQKQLAPGNSIQVLGQIQSMNSAFRNLGIGLLFAAVFVYLLMVVNYQNFGDPFVVILALPATLTGILTMLFATGSTINVPSMMGAIMAVGVASANSILLVTFAREQQLAGKSAFEAAIAAGHTRIRPVLMTAAAMIVGMIPMAIGGAGEEQNAVLARAVIGGLLFATPTTLLVVPYLFAVLRKRNDGKPAHGVFSEELT